MCASWRSIASRLNWPASLSSVAAIARLTSRTVHPLSMRLPEADMAIIDRAAKPVRERIELLKRPAPWESKASAE